MQMMNSTLVKAIFKKIAVVPALYYALAKHPLT